MIQAACLIKQTPITDWKENKAVPLDIRLCWYHTTGKTYSVITNVDEKERIYPGIADHL